MGRWRNMVTAKNEMTWAFKVLKSAILIHVRVPAQPAFALHVSYILEYVLRHMNSECLQILFVDGKIKSIQKPHWSLSVVICQNEVSCDLLHTKSIHCAKFLCSLSDNVFPSIGWQVGSIEQSCAFSFGTSSLFRHKFVTCCSNGRVAFFYRFGFGARHNGWACATAATACQPPFPFCVVNLARTVCLVNMQYCLRQWPTSQWLSLFRSKVNEFTFEVSHRLCKWLLLPSCLLRFQFLTFDTLYSLDLSGWDQLALFNDIQTACASSCFWLSFCVSLQSRVSYGITCQLWHPGSTSQWLV